MRHRVHAEHHHVTGEGWHSFQPQASARSVMCTFRYADCDLMTDRPERAWWWRRSGQGTETERACPPCFVIHRARTVAPMITGHIAEDLVRNCRRCGAPYQILNGPVLKLHCVMCGDDLYVRTHVERASLEDSLMRRLGKGAVLALMAALLLLSRAGQSEAQSRRVPLTNVSVTSAAAVVLCPADAAMLTCVCGNTSSSDAIRYGDDTVTATKGAQISGGSTISAVGPAAVYGIAESTTVTMACTVELK